MSAHAIPKQGPGLSYSFNYEQWTPPAVVQGAAPGFRIVMPKKTQPFRMLNYLKYWNCPLRRRQAVKHIILAPPCRTRRLLSPPILIYHPRSLSSNPSSSPAPLPCLPSIGGPKRLDDTQCTTYKRRINYRTEAHTSRLYRTSRARAPATHVGVLTSYSPSVESHGRPHGGVKRLKN